MDLSLNDDSTGLDWRQVVTLCEQTIDNSVKTCMVITSVIEVDDKL